MIRKKDLSAKSIAGLTLKKSVLTTMQQLAINHTR